MIHFYWFTPYSTGCRSSKKEGEEEKKKKRRGLERNVEAAIH